MVGNADVHRQVRRTALITVALFAALVFGIVVLAGGAISVVRTAYRVPAGSCSRFRKRRMPPRGRPMRPGELNT